MLTHYVMHPDATVEGPFDYHEAKVAADALNMTRDGCDYLVIPAQAVDSVVRMARRPRVLYAIQATVSGVQVPIFYLDANVQGITDEGHAERIARKVLTTAMTEDLAVHVTAVKV